LKKGILLIASILLMSMCMDGKSKHICYKKGSYEGTGQGHHGQINVVVTTDEYEIKEIKIVEEYEMPELSKIVYDKIPKMVIESNSAEVDVVAGASFTSKGLIEAIEDGLDKAIVDQ
jgi:uncharacterized protein with FMN-binding domain